METPETIRTSLQQGEWVTCIDFKDAYFHIPIQEQSRKYLRFHIQDRTFQFKALQFGLSTVPMEFTVIAKEVKVMAIQKGIRIHLYLDDWLVRATSHRVCLQHTQVLVKMCQDLGWLVNIEKSFCMLPIRSRVRSGPTDTGPVAKPTRKNTGTSCPTGLFGEGVHVLDRPVNSHRKTSSSGQTTHEAHSMASQKQLEDSGILRKSDSPTQNFASSSTMVAQRKQCSHRPTITPIATCSADLYRRIKTRVGRSLKRVYCKRNLIPTGKQTAHKLSGTKSSFSSLKRVSKSMRGQNGSNRN